MTPDQLLDALIVSAVPKTRIADALGRSHPAASNLLAGKRALKANEIAPLTKLLHQWRLEKAVLHRTREELLTTDVAADAGRVLDAADKELRAIRATANQQEMSRPDDRYVGVPMLPMYGGMGGGGIGEVLKDEELEKRLVPKALIEDILRGRPADFIWIRVRGDSMEPDFQHDDELICDLRDTSPVQPGPFALFHEDGYYVKNVERTEEGRVRIFSSNPKYTSVEIANELTQIIGRPVWFGRRL